MNNKCVDKPIKQRQSVIGSLLVIHLAFMNMDYKSHINTVQLLY